MRSTGPSGSSPPSAPDAPRGFRRLVRLIGPGVITGAADDDPSGIATYSIAGAQLGTELLWTSVVTWPPMAAVQMMCARIGMVTGEGLAVGLRRKLPRWVCLSFVVALLAANTINVGADLAGMADAAQLLTGVSSRFFAVVFAAGLALATVRFHYAPIARVLKWLVLSLGAYVVTAFLAHPDWSHVLHDTFAPQWPHGRDAWEMIVAILGTTISPYLFFWQSAQEVEEEKAMGRCDRVHRQGATAPEIRDRQIDVGLGTFCSNLVMFFVILACASTLHTHGITKIETTKDAAQALRPLAGNAATLLYTLGIIGVGCLAIPTLAGSAAYACAETFDWTEGLDEPFKRARKYYSVLVISIFGGLALDFLPINPIRALYATAVINGLGGPRAAGGDLPGGHRSRPDEGPDQLAVVPGRRAHNHHRHDRRGRRPLRRLAADFGRRAAQSRDSGARIGKTCVCYGGTVPAPNPQPSLSCITLETFTGSAAALSGSSS